jgi:hypothetical protein
MLGSVAQDPSPATTATGSVARRKRETGVFLCPAEVAAVFIARLIR